MGPEAGSSPPHPSLMSLVNSNIISPRHFGESQNREMKREESISAKQRQEKEVKAPANGTTHGFACSLSPANCCVRAAACVWKCCCKMHPSGVLKARGLATSWSTNKGCWHSQMDGKCVYFCQGIFYVFSALILQEVAGDKRGAHSVGAWQTHSMVFLPAPALPLCCAASLMLLPEGKPKIHGQEDELQRQRSCFVLACIKQLCQALSFSPAPREAFTHFSAAWRS